MAGSTHIFIGISTSVGIGGDPIIGSSFLDILEFFERDDDTDAVMLIGAVRRKPKPRSGRATTNMRKPLIAYIAGLSAPKGRRMGRLAPSSRHLAVGAGEG